MARIESLMIQGIRSFGTEHKERQVIHFNSPLTLILGRNGCGKTTIIEALKYSVTGEMPFGKGAAFIHDPKLAREIEVRGQVRLKFKSSSGLEMCVSRSLLGCQKAKKLEVTSTDNTITTTNPVTKKEASVSSRCASVNDLVVQNFGVSKAILNSVIFCHQEDCAWPLDEGKKVKEKFDEIFDSTKHNKCLEEIRKLRKTYLAETKKYKMELAFLQEKRDLAVLKRVQLEDVKKRYTESLDRIRELEESLDPITEDFKKWEDKHNNYARLQADQAKKKAQYESLVTHVAEIKQSIGEEFVGSKEDLQNAISEFKLQMRDKAITRDRLENQIARLKSQDDSTMETINENMNRLGELQAEISLQEQLINERNQTLQKLLKMCGLSELHDAPSETDIRQNLLETKEHLENSESQLGRMRKQHDEEEKSLQSAVDAKRVQVGKLEQEIKSKDESLHSIRCDIREKSMKLQEADESARRLDEVEAEIDLYRFELDNLRSSLDVNSLKEQINSRKETCKRLEERQAVVSDEVKALLVHSSNQNKLIELEKQESAITTTLRKLRSKTEDGINRLIKDVPEGSMNHELQNKLRILELKIKRDMQQISMRQQEINSLTLQRKHKKDQLTQAEEEVRVASDKLYELCGMKPLNSVIEEEEIKLQSLQDETGMLSSSEYLYKQYINKLRQKDPCCPLCQRNFDAQQDAISLIQELSGKISTLPTRVEDNKEKLQGMKAKLNKLLALRPTNERMLNLKEKEIPSLKSELVALEMELDGKQQDLAVMQAGIIIPQEDETLARSMLADVAVMDQQYGEMKKLSAEINRIKALLPAGGLKRTVEEAQAENDVLRGELMEYRTSREKMEAQLQKHRESVNQLEQKINQRVTEQLKIKSLVQQRVQIEERLQELNMTLSSIEAERDELRNTLKPTSAEMTSAEHQLRQKRQSHRIEFESATKDFSRKKSTFEEVTKLQSDIISREKKRLKDQLEDLQKDINLLNRQRNDYKINIAESEARLKELIEEISDAKNKERDLMQNIVLRTKREESTRLGLEADRLKADMGSMNYAEIRDKIEACTIETKRITGMKNKLEGSTAELKTNIKERQAELQQNIYRLAEEQYKRKFMQAQVHDLTEKDLQKFYVAYDFAMMAFHKEKMKTINSIIRELWMRIYRGNDIDYIEIRTDENRPSITDEADKRRKYDYRVVQIKNDTELDMRGRCSAGQKVLASLVIRMALAETFSLNCGILTLDEPTTNLDEANIVSLSEAILEIVQRGMTQENFQLVVITHDVDFLKLMTEADFISHYYEVTRNHAGKSVIRKCNLED